jgi:ABC-type branched-subunit amino acid transport system ATPase component
MLHLQDITGGYTAGHDILQGVSLHVPRGEAVGIIGLNGSGKSTLGRAILNTLPHRKGKIRFDGEDVTDDSTPRLANKGIAFFMQGAPVFDQLTLWENLLLAANGNRAAIADIQKHFPLLNRSHSFLARQRADKLSGGQRHQLGLAMSILKKPKMMVLDEPSAGLSPAATQELYAILRNICAARQIAIILIEQNVTLALDFCPTVHILQQGRTQPPLRGTTAVRHKAIEQFWFHNANSYRESN